MHWKGHLKKNCFLQVGATLAKFQHRVFFTVLTCHVLCPLDGSGHGRPLDERSRLAQGWRPSVCSERRCGTTGRSVFAARQRWSDCRPTKRSNETVGWYPEQRDAVRLSWGHGNAKGERQYVSAVCCYLYASMAAQVEVKLKGMGDAGVHGRPCRNVPTFANLSKEREHKRTRIHKEGVKRRDWTLCGGKSRDEYPLRLVGTEEACVMAFLHHNICDSWLIVFLQFNTGISDGK